MIYRQHGMSHLLEPLKPRKESREDERYPIPSQLSDFDYCQPLNMFLNSLLQRHLNQKLYWASDQSEYDTFDMSLERTLQKRNEHISACSPQKGIPGLI